MGDYIIILFLSLIILVFGRIMLRKEVNKSKVDVMLKDNFFEDYENLVVNNKFDDITVSIHLIHNASYLYMEILQYHNVVVFKNSVRRLDVVLKTTVVYIDRINAQANIKIDNVNQAYSLGSLDEVNEIVNKIVFSDYVKEYTKKRESYESKF